ncbi:uncharacterized protein N7496_009626 [Penicillium cataractarum]|uniref:Metallo-beta-lactamase domain-containing protein n=1 Tax=Penicillium cataractarum TaxID=2100454 RepID=A0A9W9RU63_9EURO|nr:uncharacterized protein N7496_009626 [Penicillium cataractarum]KAJ5363913.1 hypothetical protein N7496_009626 [Penicillium cataractarum]
MSTFNGVLAEFPDIQIDYFRKSDDRPPPLACFLTHVHTDHLQGLESFRAPFIYCSPTTRELLLRLERFPHRINFQQGILEAREVTYKHLNKLLRPIPLNTPTEIELTPIKKIRVTLIDANHCPGSVMFLIEGNGKSILYTGDIRAEKWWVDSLIRNPFLIPYTLAGKQLDNLYLDTTYLRHAGIPPEKFSSKAEGIAELLERVQRFPPETVFHLGAWTFGYEEVWLALAAALRTKVHPDAYQLALYQSLGQANRGIDESAAYNGFELGNKIIPGCLTSDMCNARIHLCVPPCPIACESSTVYIKPFLGREEDGFEVPDMGEGGGSGDVYLRQELVLPPDLRFFHLVNHCTARMEIFGPEDKAAVKSRLLEDLYAHGGRLSISKYGISLEDNLPLDAFLGVLARQVLAYDGTMHTDDAKDVLGNPRRKIIRFPYARHSSYSELCHLISVFRPNDIHACVVHDRDILGGKALVDEFFGHLLTSHAGDAEVLEHRKDQVAEAEEVWRAASSVRQNLQENEFPEPDPIVDPPVSPRSFARVDRMGYELIRELKENWLLLANVEHDFSSLPIAEETGITNRLLQLIDPPTPGMVKEKRDEIERAHEYLAKRSDLMEMEVGPLPPAMFRGLDGADGADVPDPNQKTEKKKSEKKAEVNPEGNKSHRQGPPTVPIRRPTTGAAQAYGSQAYGTHAYGEQTYGEQTYGAQAHGAQAYGAQAYGAQAYGAHAYGAQAYRASSSNAQSPTEPAMATRERQTSIPESVLAPSLSSSRYVHPRSGNLTRERLEVLNIIQRREMSAAQQRHARIEAYLAAIEDSYSAWAGRLTSAGDNHGEEEMEL